MSTYTRTLAVKHLGETPDTVTVDGLPEEVASSIGDYAATLVLKVNEYTYERQAARRAAYRLAEQQQQEVRQAVNLTEEQRLNLARKGELSSRPVTAEISIGYPLAGGGASMRLYNATGDQVGHLVHLTERPRHRRNPDLESWYAGPITHGAMTEGLLNAAGYHLARMGFNYGRGDQWSAFAGSDAERKSREEWAFASREYTTDGRAPYLARVSLVPTAAYLAYVEASYGPAPVLAELADLPEEWVVRRVQRGWWEITTGGRRLAITWTPMIGREVWGARSEDHEDPDAERFNVHHDDAPGAVAALVAHLSA